MIIKVKERKNKKNSEGHIQSIRNHNDFLFLKINTRRWKTTEYCFNILKKNNFFPIIPCSAILFYPTHSFSGIYQKIQFIKRGINGRMRHRILDIGDLSQEKCKGGISGVMAKRNSRIIGVHQACWATTHVEARQRTWERLLQEDKFDTIPDTSDHLKMSFRQLVKSLVLIVNLQKTQQIKTRQYVLKK